MEIRNLLFTESAHAYGFRTGEIGGEAIEDSLFGSGHFSMCFLSFVKNVAQPMDAVGL